MKKFFFLFTFSLIIVLVSSSTSPTQEIPLPSSTPTQYNEITDFSENHTIATRETEEPKNFSVFISPTGKKYHYHSTCAGKNAISVSLEEAKNYLPFLDKYWWVKVYKKVHTKIIDTFTVCTFEYMYLVQQIRIYQSNATRSDFS